MSYAIGINTSIIKTNLTKHNAHDKLEQLWNEVVIKGLGALVKEEPENTKFFNSILGEEQELVDIPNLLSEVCDFTFEESDYPAFPSKTINSHDNGTIQVSYCTENGDCHGEALTDFFCLAVQDAFGTDAFYTRRSECDYSGGHDIVESNVYTDGHCKVVYSSF